jgi:hypothetical protein
MESPHHSRTNQAVALVGSILVFIGILTVVLSSWAAFSSLGRIAIVALPLLALYGVAALTRQSAESREIGQYTLVTASAILPFVLGVIGYEAKVFTQVTAGTVAALAALSALNAGLVEFLGRQRSHTPVTLVSILAAAVAFAIWLELGAAGSAVLLLLTGAVIMAIAISHPSTDGDASEVAWHATGFSVFLLSTITFPPSLINEGVFSDSSTSSLLAVGYAVMGALMLIAALLYSRLWQVQKSHIHLHQLRSVAEWLAPLMAVAPAIIVSLPSRDPAPFVILVIVSAVCALLSIKVRMSWYRILALTGLAVALARLILFGIEELSILWPVALVTVGILLILTAAIGAKTRAFAHSLLRLPDTSWEGLGEPLPDSAHDNTRNEGPDTLVGWLWFALLLAGLYVLSTF